MKIIPQDKLIKYRWYVGRGRNNNVAFWDGDRFLTIGNNGEWIVKYEQYYMSKDGCFQPFLMIDEGLIIPHGNTGWASHYGKGLIFNKDTRKKRVSSEQFRRKHQLDLEELVKCKSKATK
ncbi:MAG: hypothetical protein QME32_04430 [Endomicrobiia bacterium]|nr:hypothetical protein [Endomicrobiia bacterium]